MDDLSPTPSTANGATPHFTFPGAGPETSEPHHGAAQAIPAWYYPATEHTAADKAYIQRFLARINSNTLLGRLDTALRRGVLPLARTRTEAIHLMARSLGIKPRSAAMYMVGCRMLRLETGGRVRGKKKRGTKTGAPARTTVIPTHLSDKTPHGRQGTKPASQLRAEAASRPTMTTDMANIDRLMTAFRSLSSQAKNWAITGLTREWQGAGQ